MNYNGFKKFENILEKFALELYEEGYNFKNFQEILDTEFIHPIYIIPKKYNIVLKQKLIDLYFPHLKHIK